MFTPRVVTISSALLLVAVFPACGGEDDGSEEELMGTGGMGSGGELGTGGASAGGALGTGGAVGSGGAETGGASAGGAPSGGSMSGGAASGGEGSGGDASGGADGSGGAASETFALSSSSWDASVMDNDDCSAESRDGCPLYPQENVSTNIGGDNISPDMSWPAGPEGTMSYAIVLHDLVFQNGFTHWGIFDIPAETTMLPEGLPSGALSEPAGAKQVGFQGSGYTGSGACGNVYEFRLYALGVESIGDPASPGDLRTALMESNDVLAETFVRLQSRDYCD